jgi:hypothetical protein
LLAVAAVVEQIAAMVLAVLVEVLAAAWAVLRNLVVLAVLVERLVQRELEATALAAIILLALVAVLVVADQALPILIVVTMLVAVEEGVFSPGLAALTAAGAVLEAPLVTLVQVIILQTATLISEVAAVAVAGAHQAERVIRLVKTTLVALAGLQFLEPLLHSTIAEQFMGVSRNGISQARHSSGCISKRHRI